MVRKKKRKVTKKSAIKPIAETWVVGIGSSAGGLEALTTFVSNLPKDFPGAFVIAQHLAPHSKSMMVELLNRHSILPVVGAKHKERIQTGMIYIIPPNNDVDVIKDHIYLTTAGNEPRPKPSVDGLFESLASAYGSRSVGIILSGTGSDGSHGITAIKEAGGVTIAQDDISAKYDGMPHSAIQTGDTDYILDPKIMAQDLAQILYNHSLHLSYPPLNPDDIQPILSIIKKEDGADFKQYKMSTIQRRIAKRMGIIGIKSIPDYMEILESTPGEVKQLSQDLLVSVTSFFRDSEVFESVDKQLQSILRKKKSGEELRIWIAGCATGEEAYSYAMLIDQITSSMEKNINVKIFASDLDQDAIMEARNAVYTRLEVEQVPSVLLKKYFNKKGADYEVVKRIRDQIVFARQNLIQNPPFVKVDLVSCRNVLIYFNPDLQKKVIDIFHYALNPSGILVLGKSESIGAHNAVFHVVDKKNKIYSKINIASQPLAFDKMTRSNYSFGLPTLSPKRSIEAQPSLTELGSIAALKTLNASAIIIDEDSNLIQIIGDVSDYLNLKTGFANLKLPNLLPKGIGLEIPILIKKAKKSTQTSRIYRIKKGGKDFAFNMIIRTLYDEGTDKNQRELFVLTFIPKIDTPSTFGLTTESKKERVKELETELSITKEQLQSVVEELGVSNEELQSVNEELQSTNEELQASSEELETTNEELQSTNEELTTLNEELNQKSVELKLLNTNLENIQNSIGSPLVVLDDKMRITNFNDTAPNVLNISSYDIGRDISKVSSRYILKDFKDRIEAAIKRGQSSEAIIEVANANFQLRILPSYDENKRIIGAILIFLDNTDRLKAQERLKDSEHRLRSILDGAQSIIFVKDTLGRYLLVNRAFKEFFGLEDSKIIGKTDRELFNDQLAVQFRDADLEVFLKVKRTKNREIIQNANGQKHTFFFNRFPLMDHSQTTPYAVGTVGIDISAQFQAQEELLQSEARYKAIIEDQAVFVCRFNTDAKLTFVNTPFCKFFGGSKESNVGQPFYRLVHELDRSRVSTEIHGLSAKDPVIQFEHRTPMFGEQHWIRWICRGMFDQNGVAQEYQAVGFDVTESRYKTDQLIEKDAVYSSIFNNTVDFLSVFKVEKNNFILESFNRSAQKAFGYISTQLVGKRLEDLIDSNRAPITKNYYQLCVAEKTPQVFEDRLEHPSGDKFYSTTLVPIADEDGKVERVAAVSRDITEHKRIENDLRKAKDAAEIANKSKSEFLASMSHELRTPLNVVLGVSQLLEETATSEDQKNLIGSIYRSGKVLLNLIEDILDVSRIEAGKIKLDSVSFSMKQVFLEIHELFHLQAKEKKIDLLLNMADDTDKIVIGDPVRLKQVVINLVGNAIKFTHSGRVEINVTSDDNIPHEKTFHISVMDTGIGIADKDHSKLFQRFSQVSSGDSRRYGGSGLGLTICQNLINLMNGQIGFQSKKGVGSTFWFYVTLPLAKNQSPTKTRAQVIDPSKVKALKILATEDNLDSQELLNRFLSKMGHNVTLASDGHETIEKLRADNYDLLLLDIQMPGIDGYETTGLIRAMNDEKSKIPIVALTANAMAGDAEKCYQAGMDDYLTKPIDIKALNDLLSRWSKKIHQN